MKTVAVIFGGRSTEHDVSIVTALSAVIKPLELSGNFKVEPIYIAKDGTWYWDDRLKDISFYQTGAVDDFMQKAPKVMLQFEQGLTLVKNGGFTGRRACRVDVVFPAMHGTHGEDGELMGLLEMAGVPYVGCGVAASAIAMDKILAKQVASANAILTAKSVHFASTDFAEDPHVWAAKINAELTYPLFVKPAHLGSSIGISRVIKPADLINALEVAAHYDDKVLVEEAVQNLIEVTLPIMGNEAPVPSYLEQPMVKSEDFFDFDTKYMHGGKGKKAGGKKGAQGYSKIPADIPESLYRAAEAVGLAVYKALGCSGLARVDMLIDTKAKKVYFNEVNPLPGDLYAHNWRAKGVTGVELVTRLVQLAEARFAARERLQTSFTTNYLKQF